MNANRLLGRLVFGSLSFHLPGLASAWMPWFAAACLLAPGNLRAAGFGFSRYRGESSNEPAQKAIILYDQGREDMVLQVRYKGPAQEFGWLIPVPGLPEVKQGSMNCFYDLSRLTQEPLWPEEFDESSLLSSVPVSQIKAVEIKTIGAFEVTVLSPQDTTSLAEWLTAHDFVLPEEQRPLLENYIKNYWYFVAVKVNPNGKGFVLGSGPPGTSAIQPSAPNGWVTGELQPLIISFPSEKCVYPLALSVVNGRPCEVSVFVLSSEPLMSRAVFEKKFAAYRRERTAWIEQRPAREKAWNARTNQSIEAQIGLSMGRPRSLYEEPGDPQPPPEVMAPLMTTSGPLGPFSESDEDFRSGEDLVKSMEIRPKDLPACVKELPRLASKSWWLTKEVETFAPEEMRDLEFEPAVPMFAEKLHTPEGPTLARWWPQFGAHVVPLVLSALSSSEPAERRMAATAMAEMDDPRLVAPLAGLLWDAEARIRARACASARTNWDSAFAPRLVQLLSDKEAEVRSAACGCLQAHPIESENHIAVYRKMVEDRGVGASSAMELLRYRRVQLPKESLIPFLSSTDPCTVALALWDLHDRQLELHEISPLLTNSLPMARFRGLVALLQIGDNRAIDRIVSMLRDPNEGLRWTVRTNLRRLSGKRLGADPAAWEKWWAENKETFKPVPAARPGLQKK